MGSSETTRAQFIWKSQSRLDMRVIWSAIHITLQNVNATRAQFIKDKSCGVFYCENNSRPYYISICSQTEVAGDFISCEATEEVDWNVLVKLSDSN